jgi:hypothetical protein
MNFRRSRPFLWLFLGVVGGAFLSDPAAAQGNAGAASLQIPPGARAEGMGRTFSAIADDAFAPWWNPGGLAFLEGRNAALMHAQLVPDLADDVYFEYASYAQHLSGWGGVALTLTYLNYGESIETDPNSSDPRGTFRSFEFAPSLAIGTAISNSLGLGANLKYVYVDLAPATASADNEAGKGSTFAVDLGALWKVPGKPLNLAVVVQNIGPDIALVDEEQADPLPRMLRLGAAYQILSKGQHSLVAAFDGDKVLLSNGSDGGAPDSTLKQTWFDENDVLLNFGGEYTYNNLVSVRLGYIFDDPGEIKDMTYGLGVTWKAISFDYASIPQNEELARVNKFSLSARF